MMRLDLSTLDPGSGDPDRLDRMVRGALNRIDAGEGRSAAWAWGIDLLDRPTLAACLVLLAAVALVAVERTSASEGHQHRGTLASVLGAPEAVSWAVAIPDGLGVEAWMKAATGATR